MVVEKVRNEEGEVTGYKAHSKNYPNIAAAEAETQMAAIQGYHRRMRIFQTTDSEAEASNADVAGNSKDPRIRV